MQLSRSQRNLYHPLRETTTTTTSQPQSKPTTRSHLHADDETLKSFSSPPLLRHTHISSSLHQTFHDDDNNNKNSKMSLRSGPSSPTSKATNVVTMTAEILKNKTRRKQRELPPIFGYMEKGEWDKAREHLRKHPREAKMWATIRIKVQNNEQTQNGSSHSPAPPTAAAPAAAASQSKTAATAGATMETKRLALHHACFKLRGAGALSAPARIAEDPFTQVCQFILTLVTLYPEAAGQRESRHGCLPLHLAAFASCAPRAEPEPSVATTANSSASSSLSSRPTPMDRRASSDATSDTVQTHLSAVHAEERYTGVMGDRALRGRRTDPEISVSQCVTEIPPHREDLLVQVLNALLDAHPRGIRSDSEGGRNALHTACAGRATPRIVATLVQADRSAARQRNKDGFLPLHLAAHWGVSHPAVVVSLLRAYPDATVGRNRWERTPLEEALCMAGENGRPHQGALVRALRKHPDYWTRPVSEIVETPVIRGPVDIDETLPSMESSYDERGRAPVNKTLLDQVGIHQYDEEGQVEVFSFGNMMQHFTGKPATAVSPVPAAVAPRKKVYDLNTPLVSIIRAQDWDAVEDRLVASPLQAEEELQVLTQGGFMASTGMTPLHFSCERNPTVRVVQLFLEAFPVAVLTRTMPGGCLPLHIACTWHAQVRVIQALLQADQGSVRIKDELGNLPLHSACFSGADTAVIQALLQADVGSVVHSVVARNHQGSKPADICRRLRHSNRSRVLQLLQQQEAIIRHRRGRSSGTWSEVAAQAEEANRREGAPAVSAPRGHQKLQQQQHERLSDMVEEVHEVTIEGDEELVWI